MSKYNRIAKAAHNASLLGMWHIEYDGHTFTVEVRGADRSHGYQTDFRPVPTYWVLSTKDGGGFTGWSTRGKAVKRSMMHLTSELCGLTRKGAIVRTVKRLQLLGQDASINLPITPA